MPTKNVQHIESFAYEGAIGLPTAIGAFVLITLFVGWLLWRERKVIGNTLATIFFLMRMGAAAIVLWMLLGPTQLDTTRTTTPQSIAIIADSSESMDVAEPLQKIESLRWNQATNNKPFDFPELVQIDKGLASLRFSISSLYHATNSVKEYAAADTTSELLKITQKSLKRAVKHFSDLAKSLDASSPELSRVAQDTSHELSDEGLKLIEKMLDAIAKGQVKEVGLDGESLDRTIDQSLRRAESLERSIVEKITESLGNTQDPQQPNLSRKEWVVRLLDRLDKDCIQSLSKTVNIKRLKVDSSTTSIGNEGWKNGLQMTSKPIAKPDAEEKTAANGPLGTNLSSTLEFLRQDSSAESTIAAILMSEGGHNAIDAMEPRVAAASLVGIPVSVLPVNSQTPQRDLAIHRVEAPNSVALHDKIVFDSLIMGQYMKGEQTTVELVEDGKVLEEKKIVFTGDRQDHRVRFTIPGESLGQHVFDVKVKNVLDESNEENNVASVAVRVVRDKTRVLLADRISRWEYRYLDQLFRRDKHVEFDKLLYSPSLIATGRLETTKELPRTVDGWAAYDVVILGDLEPTTFDQVQQSSLEEWVKKRAGNLIVIAGNEFMPQEFKQGSLSSLLPVQELPSLTLDRNGYSASFTSEGARHEALMLADTQPKNAEVWAEQFRAVPIYFLSSYCKPKPAAHTLIEAALASENVAFTNDTNQGVERAFLSYQDVGTGRVVFLASPATYHLRFRKGDELHFRFWGQMLRWLTAAERGKGQTQLFVKTSSSNYEYGEKVEVSVSLANEDNTPIVGVEISAQAESPGKEAIMVNLVADENVPGKYLGRFEKLPPGTYRFSAVGKVIDQITKGNPNSDGSSTIVNIIAPENIELSDTRGNRALLHEVAQITGGQVLSPNSVSEILELSALEPRVLESSSRMPLWNRWSFLLIVTACLSIEWGIRRYIGLV